MALGFFYVKMPGPTAGLVGTLRDIDGLEEFKLMIVLSMKMTEFLGLSPIVVPVSCPRSPQGSVCVILRSSQSSGVAGVWQPYKSED